MKQNKTKLRSTLVKIGLVGALFGFLCIGTYKSKIEPVGWHDFNGDGTPDAIITFAGGSNDPFHYFNVIDGQNVYKDENGDFRYNGIPAFIPMRSLNTRPIRRSDWGENLTAVVRDLNGDGTLDMKIYTSADAEPGFKSQSHYDIE